MYVHQQEVGGSRQFASLSHHEWEEDGDAVETLDNPEDGEADHLDSGEEMDPLNGNQGRGLEKMDTGLAMKEVKYEYWLAWRKGIFFSCFRALS